MPDNRFGDSKYPSDPRSRSAHPEFEIIRSLDGRLGESEGDELDDRTNAAEYK